MPRQHPTPEFPKTDITYNGDGKIVQLDTYVPEVADGEVQIGINMPELAKAHPFSSVEVTHNVEDLWGRIAAVATTDMEYADPLAKAGEVPLKVNQHTGVVQAKGIDIAVSYHPLEAPNSTVIGQL